MPAFVVALDQGTTSSRAIVFDHRGSVRSIAQREFTQIYPEPAWVEHDPREIWASQLAVVVEALSRAGIEPGDVAALGITNQRETSIVWNRETGEPVHNAIVWQDRRTAGACRKLVADGREPMIQAKTGLVADAYFSATKIGWVLDNIPGARRDARDGKLAAGTVDSWLLWQLTGGELHATDVTNASRTMLYDIHDHEWDDELLELFDIPREILPEVAPSSRRLGEAVPEPLRGIPIGGVAGDQQAALLGQACIDPGMAKCTYGTGCFVLMNAGRTAPRSAERLITTVAWDLDPGMAYALEGSVFTGGAVVQWLRDGLGVIASAEEIERLAATVEDSGGVFFVPAFTGLGAPHWDPDARGLIAGLTRGATAGHVARAALEGIAYQVADVLDAMRADAGTAITELRVDGGAAANDLLMQFQADLLGVPVVRPALGETTALGAAFLAGLATGIWDGPEELRELGEVDRRFEPAMGRDEAHSLRRGWSAALDRARSRAEERS
jgi:glycerol kinase